MDQKQRAYFNDQQGRAFDESVRSFLAPLTKGVNARLQRIVATARIQPGEIVLDVGTGTGCLIPLIQHYHPGRIIGCDLSEKMLEQVARAYPGVERYQCDIQDLKQPASSIDVVLMNAMYGNIADKKGALANIVRMLRPGGRVIISHPEGRAFVQRLVKEEPYPVTPLPSEDEAHTLLKSFGLRVRQYTDEQRLLIVLAVKE